MTSPSVLFVRSVPPALAVPALTWLRAHTPGATITALTSPSGRLALEGAGVVDACEIHDGPRLSLAAAGPHGIVRLARRRFDLVVVPYAGHRRDYWNVAHLALAIRGRTTVWLRCDQLPAAGTPAMALHRVSLGDWWREARTLSHLRSLALHTIKWPLLVAGYVLGMAALAALATLLVPLVWLKPGPGGRG